MEDGQYLNKQDKIKMADLKDELSKLKTEHKKFAANKGTLSSEDRLLWKENSQRTNEIYIEIKDLRLKNILEAGK